MLKLGFFTDLYFFSKATGVPIVYLIAGDIVLTLVLLVVILIATFWPNK